MGTRGGGVERHADRQEPSDGGSHRRRGTEAQRERATQIVARTVEFVVRHRVCDRRRQLPPCLDERLGRHRGFHGGPRRERSPPAAEVESGRGSVQSDTMRTLKFAVRTLFRTPFVMSVAVISLATRRSIRTATSIFFPSNSSVPAASTSIFARPFVRPAVEAGERLGFLPGTLSEKIDPYLRQIGRAHV